MQLAWCKRCETLWKTRLKFSIAADAFQTGTKMEVNRMIAAIKICQQWRYK
jgi:hypothetical protein